MAVLSIVLTAGLSSDTQAAHWPLYGGDAGRSAHQPVDPVRMPLGPVYALTGPSERNIRTSVSTSNGRPQAQRVTYGTENGAPGADGNVHLQILATGAPVGPEAGVDIDDGANDPATFPAGLVETSTPTALGEVLAVHNDADQDGPDDIAIARIDEESGRLVGDSAVAGTDGFRLSGSPVVTDPQAGGERYLFFRAERGIESRIYRVALALADPGPPSLGAVTSRSIPGPGPLLALAFLDDVSGTPQLHVLVSGEVTPAPPGMPPPCYSRGYLAALRATDLSDGPQASRDCASFREAVVPVSPTGALPGGPGSGASKAPAVFASVDDVYFEYFPRLLRLEQKGDDLATAASYEGFLGAGVSYQGPVEIATSAIARGSSIDGGWVFANDAPGLRFLDTGLSERGGSTVRGHVASSGDFVFVASETGRQHVIRASDGRLVSPWEFTEDARNAGSTRSSGPPAVSSGYVQFSSDRGLFVYRSGVPTTTGGSSTAGGLDPTGPVSERSTPARVVARARPRRISRRRISRPGVTVLLRGRVVPPLSSPSRCVPGARLLAVRIRAARRTLLARSLNLRVDCSFRGRMRLRLPRRLRRARAVEVHLRFLGNRELGPKRARRILLPLR